MFKPGISGNPKGRPRRGEAITDLLRVKIEEKTPEKNISRKERIIEKLISMSESGNLEAIRYLINRLDGSPVAQVNIGQSEIDNRLIEALNGNRM